MRLRGPGSDFIFPSLAVQRESGDLPTTWECVPRRTLTAFCLHPEYHDFFVTSLSLPGATGQDSWGGFCLHGTSQHSFKLTFDSRLDLLPPFRGSSLLSRFRRSDDFAIKPSRGSPRLHEFWSNGCYCLGIYRFSDSIQRFNALSFHHAAVWMGIQAFAHRR